MYSIYPVKWTLWKHQQNHNYIQFLASSISPVLHIKHYVTSKPYPVFADSYITVTRIQHHKCHFFGSLTTPDHLHFMQFSHTIVSINQISLHNCISQHTMVMSQQCSGTKNELQPHDYMHFICNGTLAPLLKVTHSVNIIKSELWKQVLYFVIIPAVVMTHKHDRN
jgi:hypothetical protein